jgi:hypothetical protein
MTPAMNGGDAVLQPAAAAARQADFGVEATRKALDHVELEGRLAVKLVQESAAAVEPQPIADERGGLVDRTA